MQNRIISTLATIMAVTGAGLVIWILYNLISISVNIDYYYLITSWLGTAWTNISDQLKNVFAQIFHIVLLIDWQLIAVLGCFLLFFLVIKSSSVIILEEERYVIYRLGRFHRVIGPGWHILLRGIETVKNRINVRIEPHDFLIKGLFINGVPFNITINLWYQYNPVVACEQDHERLSKMVQFNNHERYEHVKIKIRDALVASLSIAEMQSRPANNSFIYKVLPVIPGMPDCQGMLMNVRQQLLATLPLVGVIISSEQPLVIVHVEFEDSIVKSLSIGRVSMLLEEQFPNLDTEAILEYAAAIEKLNLWASIHKTSTPAYTRLNEDVTTDPRVRITPSAPQSNTPFSDESVEQFAVAKIKDHEPGQPFIVGKNHTLITGIVGERIAGYELRKISLPKSEHELRIDIMVYAEDMNVKPHWIQSYVVDMRTQRPSIEFILQPQNSGPKFVRVDYFFQQNWLTKIEFDVDVVEQLEPAYVNS